MRWFVTAVGRGTWAAAMGCLCLAALGCVEAAGGRGALTTERVSKPFRYSGYSSAEYAGVRKFSECVEMDDGVRLAVDVYLPTEGPARKSFPVIFQYTPYQRASVDVKTGRVRDLTTSPRGRYFLSYGYGLVFADMRGTGASEGWLMDFMPRIANDGKALVDWMAGQEWCDGNVGMMGGSYLGWSQTATASRRPAALKCIMPAVIPLEGYTGEVYPGGIYLQGFLKRWSGGMYTALRNYVGEGHRPTAPVVDEDGDGELADEIPVDVNGNGSFLDDGDPPTYADRNGGKRKHIYYRATKMHEKDYDYASWATSQFFLDVPSPLGDTLYELGPNAHVPAIMKSGIPMYHVGGWFDGFARGSFELFCTMRETNPSRVVISPGYHSVTSGPYYEYLGEDRDVASKRVLTEHLRFFDRYLKGIKNGIDREDPILIYVMNGEGWRQEKEWPLRRAETKTLYFGEGQGLSKSKPEGGSDDYKADFTHDSSYGSNGGNRWLGISGLTPNGLPIRTEKDEQCLTYTSAAAEADTEVTGHPIVRLWVSSTADHGDFFVYLEDVSPEGEVVLVTEGQLRAGFAGLHDNDTIIARGEHGIEVLPELPWHGYEKDQYVDGILADGKAVELVIDLHPTSWVFREGHRMRVSIACADYPTYRLHPKLSPQNSPEASDNIVPTVTVHRGGERASSIALPVIPR